MTQLHDAAMAFHDAGCAVIPARTDATKAPAVNWREYQTTRPTREQVDAWMSSGSYDGFGVLTGAVSGGLEMLELEGRAVADELGVRIGELAGNSGLGDLWAHVLAGYLEFTPSGGMHVLYRVDTATGTVAGNTRLAATIDRKVLAETRGEGGYTITAPSGGRTHPNGGPWTLIAGNPTTIPTISAEQRDALHTLMRAFDATPAPEPIPEPRTHDRDTGALRPGDDYNTRATWTEILTPLSWQRVWASGGVTYWRRPGKNTGISATTGRNDADNLWVFTTSTIFEAERPYSKFAAHALLEHSGDYARAAKALAAKGYGAPARTIIDLREFVPPPTVDAAPPTDAPEPLTLAHTDDANACHIINTHGYLLRHNPQRARWLCWEGTQWVWQAPGGGHAREHAKNALRALPDTDRPDAAHKQRSLTSRAISAALESAATDPRISVDARHIDADPWALNTPGGVVDLRTGTLTAPNPNNGVHTRITACAPDPDADPEPWQRFLNQTFNNDQTLIAYLQRLAGYSATGVVGAHILPFCHGSGGNGKGVFLEAVAGALGDYASSAPVGFLMRTQYTEHETQIARLAGARMVICSEVNDTDQFDEAKVKQLTGGDTLTARFMRQDHFTFKPSHQLWLMGNSHPTVRTGGRAFWRRVRLIPFLHEVPEALIIDDLQGQLVRDNGGAVMQWIIDGAKEYAMNGLSEPASVKSATAEYARDQDTVTRFIEEQAIIGGGEHVKIKCSIVRDAYEAWCRAEGDTPVSAKALSSRLASLGVGLARSNVTRLYTGIAMRGDETSRGTFAAIERECVTRSTQIDQGGEF